MLEIKRKKVLWLSHLVPYPPKGGVLQRSYNLLRELAKYHDVYLLALVQPDLAQSQNKTLSDQLIEAHDDLSRFCREVEFVKLPHLEKPNWKHKEALRALLFCKSYSINWLRSESGKQLARKWHEQHNFDLIHCDTISLISIVPWAPQNKLIVNHHNVESHMMLRRAKKENNPLKKAYFYQEAMKIYFYEKKWCSRAALNLTCSELDAIRLQEITSTDKTQVVENGVDLDYFTPVKLSERKSDSLIFAGGLGWYPNLDAMRHFSKDIWPEVLTRNPRVTMNLVGRGKDVELQQTATRHPESFILHGFVDDVRPYLSSASVYVCPIRDGGGTKLKMLDAMAMKCAIVAYPEASEGIAAQDRKHLRIVYSAKEMIDTTLELLKDQKQREDLGDAARELIEKKYSFTSIGQKMAATYSRI